MKRNLILLSMVLIAAFAFGQSTETTAPPTDAPAPPLTGTTEMQTTSSMPRYEENVRPLSGVQDFDIGNRTDRMNVLLPSFTFSEGYGTNPGLTTGTQGDTIWGSTTTVGGSLRMKRGDARRLFSLSYGGVAQFSSNNDTQNTQIHSLELTEAITAGRWSYVLGDALTYQPNAFASNGALLFPGSDIGTPGADLKPGTGPNSSVLAQNKQLNNTALGQISYGLSRSSVVTGSVSYGVLHYLDDNFLDSKEVNLTGGYDHSFGHNTVGVKYTYSKFMYDNVAANFDTNTIQATYGRRVIGRLSFNLGAGPTFRITTTGTTSRTDAAMTAHAGLLYYANRTNVQLTFDRAVTSGSGITPGALTNLVSASLNRELTRNLSGQVTTGFARNTSNSTGNEVSFDTVYVGTGISHPVGRHASVALGYRGQRQTSNTQVAQFSTHSVVVSFVWNVRPIRLK